MNFNLSSSSLEPSRAGRVFPGLGRINVPIVIDLEYSFLLVALGVFIATRLWHLAATPLSYDEIFSIDTVQHDWSGLFAFVRQDMVHPPLFYILLKLWRAVGGESVSWLRLFPALTAILAIIPLLRLYRELQLRVAEVGSALVLTAANAYLIYYSQSLRMYSLFFLLSLCSLWFFVRLLKNSNDSWPLWALFVANLLLVYTHYFGWVLIASEFLALCLLWRSRVLSFTLTTALIALCFSPWIYAVSQAYIGRGGLHQNIGWINRPHLSDITSFINTLNDRPFDFRFNGILGILLFGSPIALWGWQTLRGERDGKPRDNTFWLLLGFSFLPIILVYSVSLLLQQSIWLPRGLIFVAVPYFALVVAAIMRLRWHWVRTIALMLILGWSILAGIKNTTQRTQEIDVKSWVHQMAQSETTDAKQIEVYALDEHIPYLMRFYLKSDGESRFHINLVKGLTPQDTDYWLNKALFQTVTIKELTHLKEDHFWFAYNRSQWEEERLPQEIFRDAGFRVGEEFKGGRKHKELYLFPVWR